MEKVFLICNAHLDPVWLWDWQEGAGEALSTFRIAADFCEEYGAFVFNHNEAMLYEWVEEYEPALFERIKRLVREGRWHIIGGWYLQPDCVMLSGESFVRQILAGRTYFKEKFGAVPTTAISFDSFGHNRGLVQILKQSGYDSYIMCRAGNAEREVEGNDFRWVGYDGSEVIAHYSDENYNSVKGEAANELEAWISKHKKEKNGLFLWGIGNHGGGASRKDIEKLALLGERSSTVLVNSAPEEYFKTADMMHLPKYEHSLGPVAEGCYTSQIRIKQLHRQLESQIYSAEKMLSHAALQGLLDYPIKQLGEAQVDLMRAQFHDALPGTAIKTVEDATIMQLGHGLEIAARLKAKAFFALCSGQKKVTIGETPILVYNPHPFPIETIIECEAVLPEQNWNDSVKLPVVYRDGEKIPCQMEQELSNFEIDWRKRSVFWAILPPFSMSRFDCRFIEAKEKPPVILAAEDGYIRFRTDILAVDISCSTGLMDRCEKDGIPFLKPSAFKAVVMNDFYNSWGVGYHGFEDIAGQFELMSDNEGSEFSAIFGDKQAIPSVRVTEDGEVRTVVEALFVYNHSTIRQRYFLPKQGSEIKIELNLVWNEPYKLLKLCLPTTIENGEYWGQEAFGREILAADGTEAVSHKWCAVCSQESGRAVSCINDGIYGSNFQNGEIRLSLVRSAGYAMSDCNGKIALLPNQFNARMDQGERSYTFWLNVGDAAEMSALDNMAFAHNEPPMPLSICPSGEGELPLPAVIISSKCVVLSAFKKANSGGDYIIRLYESTGNYSITTLEIPLFSVKATLQLAPFEVKTLRLNAETGTLTDCPLLEKEFLESTD